MLVLRNGRVVVLTGHGTGTKASFVDCMAVKGDLIEHVGSFDDLPEHLRLSADTEVVDLHQKIVTPGFIDGHMHLLLLGQALTKVDLHSCRTLEEIQSTIKAHAVANPDAARIMCKGWLQGVTGEGVAPHKSMLDAIDPRPILIDSNGLHSAWCNSAALAELGLEDVADPPGGMIHRDDSGKATGLLSESVVFTYVWPYLARVSSVGEKVAAIRAAIDAYTAEGYTGVIEMAMDEHGWEALRVLFDDSANPPPPVRVSAHWLIRPLDTEAETLKQVERAITLNSQFNGHTSPDCRVVGIKVICDGTVDTCTAALASSYGGMTEVVEPLWPRALLEAVVAAASRAGLQCALHAIGDAAVTTAIDVLSCQGQPSRTNRLRHRIEHLELTTEEDARRLGRLGITASVQPLHADPAALRAWPRLIGRERCARAFAYAEFEEGGAVLALGTDAPTAPHAPLKGMYVATTGRSVREAGVQTMETPREGLSLASALAAATRGAAWSCGAEGSVGTLEKGMKADFCILGMEWEAGRLLDAKVEETWFDGRRVWRRNNG